MYAVTLSMQTGRAPMHSGTVVMQVGTLAM